MTHEELKNWFNQNYKSSITMSTVTKILKNVSIGSNNGNLRFKKSRSPRFPLLEKNLFEWFLRNENVITITDAVLIEMEKQFKDKMGIESDIIFNNGWVRRFKLKNNISLRRYEGEASSANVPAINIELPKIKNEIKKYNLDYVFNFDECALFYRLEPDKTLATKRLSWRKKNKERITIGLCSNATGTTKLKPMVNTEILDVLKILMLKIWEFCTNTMHLHG